MSKIDCIICESGHGLHWGGVIHDNGASYGDITEYEINCAIAERVVAILQDKKELKNALIQGVGYKKRATKAKKIAYANSVIDLNNFNPAKTLYICIHCNDNNGFPGTGVEVWLGNRYLGSCKKLGECIRKAEAKYFDLRDRGNKARSLYHQRMRCVSVLSELGFINNSYDLKCITDYDRMAEAVSHGIMNYIRN